MAGGVQKEPFCIVCFPFSSKPQLQDTGLPFGLLEERSHHLLRQDQVKECDAGRGTVQKVAVSNPAAEFIIRRLAIFATLEESPHAREKGIQECRNPVWQFRILTSVDPLGPLA